MTGKADTLARWLALWERDESLRPEGWGDRDVYPMYVKAACVRDAAVRWLMEHDWEKLDDVMRVEPDELDDDLYEAVQAVLEEDHPA